MIVTAHIKFGLHSNFLDSMLQAEDERLPGESVDDGSIRVYKKLEAAVERLRKEAGQSQPEQLRHNPAPVAFNPIPIISKDTERLEIEIDNATTIEDLKSIKESNPVMPFPVLKLYNAKMEDLSK